VVGALECVEARVLDTERRHHERQLRHDRARQHLGLHGRPALEQEAVAIEVVGVLQVVDERGADAAAGAAELAVQARERSLRLEEPVVAVRLELAEVERHLVVGREAIIGLQPEAADQEPVVHAVRAPAVAAERLLGRLRVDLRIAVERADRLALGLLARLVVEARDDRRVRA
jgi:hypothetical protein